MTPDRLEIDLPWPSRDLHPNARHHWTVKAHATRAAKAGAWALTNIAGGRNLRWPAARYDIAYAPPNRRAHDEDGVIASLKASLDGIASAMGVDDRTWRIGVVTRLDPVKGGAVRITLTPIFAEQAND